MQNRDLLLNEFVDLPKQQLPVADLLAFIKQKAGSYYDPSLFTQLTQVAQVNGMIDLQEFADAYLETEGTFQYRLEKLFNDIHEKKLELDGLSQRIEQEKGQTGVSHLLVQILSAANIEPLQANSEVNSYVVVKCANEAYHTKSVVSKNPTWSESFDFQVYDSSTAQSLIIEMFDANRGRGNELYGSLQFSLAELRKTSVKDINQNVARQDVKMKAKLQAKIKFIRSKENTLHQEYKKLTEDIEVLENESRQNEAAIRALHKPFKSYSSNLLPIRSQVTKVTTHHDVVGPQTSYLEVHDLERSFAAYLESFGLVQDWTRVYLPVAFVFIVLCLFTNLYRPMLLDLTYTSLIVACTLQRSLTQRVFRILTFACVLQFINDIVWLANYSENWTNYPGETHGQNSWKHFTIVMSVLVFIVRVPFTLLTWKHSIHFNEFQTDLYQYAFLH